MKFKGLVAIAAIAMTSTAVAMPIEVDTKYVLKDHPNGGERPPTYGLRLDGLVWGDTNHVYTFEFEGNGAGMHMYWDGAAETISIYGKAWGGKNQADGYAPDAAKLWDIMFTYTNVRSCGGALCGDENPTSMGTISDGSNTYKLVAEAGNHGYAFKLVNGLYRTYDGISGFGWMNHCPTSGSYPNGVTCDNHLYASDWLFTAHKAQVPEPGTLALLGIGLAGIGLSRRRKRSC